ncbi:MAG: polyphenol oxidase family protein [Gemmatimonadaceae bacterium]
MRTPRLDIEELSALGVVAFTTTREAGSFNTSGSEPVGEVMGRWWQLNEDLRPFGGRLATARQVHGTTVLVHSAGWSGWLRSPAADGHLATERGIGLAVTVADCVPIFMAHPSGQVALLHSGWRGTAAGILEQGIANFERLGRPASELQVHFGPSICGRCYEVSPDVYAQVTGRSVAAPSTVDLRTVLADRARARGVLRVTVSAECTRCDNDRFYSHRAGDAGRQLGVLMAPLDSA